MQLDQLHHASQRCDGGRGRLLRAWGQPLANTRDGVFDNVAAKYPEKLKELEPLFWEEAAKYQVLPLDASVATRLVSPRPSLAAGRSEFTWSGEITGTPNGDAPSILDASYSFKAEVDIPQGGAEGMIVTQGGRITLVLAIQPS